VWFNCATCHTGTVTTADPNDPQRTVRHIVPGMPSNNLDLYRFIRFLLDAGANERLSADRLIPAMNATGPKLGKFETAIYRYYVIPLLREGLIARPPRPLPLLAQPPAWGPGRVDTFNPYKLIQADMPLSALAPAERIGTADFPAIFHQGPREGMHLHWDGNNTSLAERNLSAALGAGVTAETADHETIDRIAKWLLDLRPPPSPHRPDAGAGAGGKAVSMRECAGGHGHQEAQDYVFTGATIGQVAPNDRLATDPHRLDSYTEVLRQFQLANFFKGTPFQFKFFVKTNGYANVPLDGLWLRAPYLHNGSVPTLAALLDTPDQRPKAFTRSNARLDT